MTDPSAPAKVVAITGASSGLGLAAAIDLVQRGYRVVGGARRFPQAGLPFEALPLDVRDAASVQRFIDAVVERHGGIGSLVNCAGTALSGALESMSDAEERDMFEVNVLGVMRLCRAALPHLRKRPGSRIVNVSSIAGRLGLPFNSTYCATKFAVEGLSESLQYELRPFGVHVVVLQPGDFLTPMTERYALSAGAATDTTYARALHHAVAVMEADCRSATDLSIFTRGLAAALRAKRPRLRYTLAVPAQALAAAAARLAPDRVLALAVERLYSPS